MTDKAREEFEAAYVARVLTDAAAVGCKMSERQEYERKKSMLAEMLLSRKGNHYHEPAYSAAWWGWQASRAAPVVEDEEVRQRAVLDIGHILIDTRGLRSAEYHQAGLIFDAGYRLKVKP